MITTDDIINSSSGGISSVVNFAATAKSSLDTITIRHKFGTLKFDAVFSEAHKSEMDIPENPTADSFLNDNSILQPAELTIVAGVTDTPVSTLGLLDVINDPFYSFSQTRSQKAYDLLVKLQEKAQSFDVQTNLKLYREMLCKSIEVTQDKDSSRIIKFTATLVHIDVVKSMGSLTNSLGLLQGTIAAAPVAAAVLSMIAF
jgi:hypothetical protein